MTTLPDPHCIVHTHDTTTGKDLVSDDVVPVTFHPSAGQGLGMAYIQRDLAGKPEEVMEGRSEKPDNGWLQTNGASSAWMGEPPFQLRVSVRARLLTLLDFPPGYDCPLHFTTSFDYLVLISGTVKLTFMDDTTKTLNAGDVFINVSGVHKWTNESDQVARFFAISLPCETLKVNGKGLDEEPIKAYKMLN